MIVGHRLRGALLLLLWTTASSCVSWVAEAPAPRTARSPDAARLQPVGVTVTAELHARNWLNTENVSLGDEQFEAWRRIVFDEILDLGWFESVAPADVDESVSAPPANQLAVRIMRGDSQDPWLPYSLLFPARRTSHWFVVVGANGHEDSEYGKVSTWVWTPLALAAPFFGKQDADERLLRAVVRALMLDVHDSFN